MLILLVHLQSRGLARDEHGQTSAEYALVLLGAAAVAVALTAWATGTGQVGRLLDGVLDAVLDKVT